MPFTNVDQFRSGFRGVRSNRYIITGNTVEGVGTLPADEFTLYAKATSFPGSAIGMIPVSYQGRIIKFSGERSFAEWAIQVYDSSSDANALRKHFEKWINAMDHHSTHVMNYNLCAAHWDIEYDQQKTGTTTTGSNYQKKMRMHNVWPVDISPIDLSYESVDSFAEFTLTLAYDHHEIL